MSQATPHRFRAQRQLLNEIKVVDFHQDLTEIVGSWASLLLGEAKTLRSRTEDPQSYDTFWQFHIAAVDSHPF